MTQFYYCFYLFLFEEVAVKITLIVNWKENIILEKHELTTLRTEAYSIVSSLFLRHFLDQFY